MDIRDITPIIAEVSKNYQYRKPPDALVFIQDMIEKLKRYLLDLLSQLHLVLPDYQTNTSMVGNIMQIVLLIAGVCAVALFVWLVWRRLTLLNTQALLAKRGQLASDEVKDADAWRAHAAELAGQPDYKLACRALYMSLLKRLDQKEVLEFVPTRTNYECWYSLARNKSLALLFRELANIVEASWFGNRTANATDYEQCLRVLDNAEQEIEVIHQAAVRAKAAAV
jgi:hypothetical protein